ncbi:sodium:calcium antiporter [Marivirga tractuosa]|uniref:Na+/Ca+ antiporter, CaCA family n=1 Tax=Marivirga tractuosa (strain ATCC 23168 / DSM 4126 / NBRC 15989 / NCIMB 1408 / VKM B-1430 / H-43) TaxID=643867 RepID=E4TT89_MARTH|nr:calcium/sodium antiporter [Marivirga tractuosa]ADR21919.1 Na+/Ca+ antiporter, CaCA family [Marivirga tractuosa DSM 4126]BDD13622.1 sodium:calcium antiporter [Marivirga tractuosa]
MPLTNTILLVVGLAVLILGGELLVRGASRIALRLKMSPLVVGVTIVAFGTSAPELLISIQAALAGSPDITMGNVIGSNICNLALVLGVTSLIAPIPVNSDSIKIDWPMTMGCSLLLYFLVQEGYVNDYEGIGFVLLLALYLFFIIRRSRKNHMSPEDLGIEVEAPTPSSKKNMIKDLSLIAIGGAGLYFGSDWFVNSAKDLAIYMGVSERIVGITVVALGTSLPELVTSVVAAFKKETDMALGNLMGSNIFNILSILGITSLISEIEVSEVIINSDMIWMMGITLIILPFMALNKIVDRYEGLILVGIYLYYTISVIS